MKPMHISKKGVVGVVIAAVVVVLVVACGGGGSGSAISGDRAQAQGAGVGSSISWTPIFIADTANPGSRQDIPVTFKTAVALKNVMVIVVPELKGLVTVSPATFESLEIGQTATVTITVAPSADVALGAVDGTILLRVGSSTIAKPLPVKVTLVAPKVINGITVPPEPPAELNNLTLAGFDANGNGVRDDVERMLAVDFSQTAVRYQEALAFARADQSLITSKSTALGDTYMNTIACTLERGLLTVDEMDKETYALLNTQERSNAYSRALAGAIGRDCQ